MVKIVIEAADHRMASVELARLVLALAVGRRKPAKAKPAETPEARPRFAGEEPPLAIFGGMR